MRAPSPATPRAVRPVVDVDGLDAAVTRALASMVGHAAPRPVVWCRIRHRLEAEKRRWPVSLSNRDRCKN
jgi:hypothetical protein